MHSLRNTSTSEPVDESPLKTRSTKLVEFENTFRNPEDPAPLASKILPCIVKKMSACNIKRAVVGLFPIIETLKTYPLKDLPNDIIAGITSGIMMIPQGMAYAALSTLPPIVGLYISFFASLTYFLFGTGRQLSWGCIAILSLMIATILDKYDNSLTQKSAAACFNDTAQAVFQATSNDSTKLSIVLDFYITANSTNVSTMLDLVSSTTRSAAETAARLEIASGVSVAVGVIFIAASRLGLSRITSIMSNSLITGFTVGISFHVVTSQLKTMFGLSLPGYRGPGAVIRTWISILQKLPETNVVTLIISVISILVIHIVKKCINDRYKKHMRVPVPIELIVVIVATLISNFTYLQSDFNVKVVETVPVGVPAPKIPDLFLVTDYIGDGLVIIVIAYAQTLAMAKTMGLKNNYIVDPNQEMLACGMCSIICGLFSGYISAASVSRSVVQDGAGGKTQVASLVAAALVLLVIVVIGPYFYHLPMCVLSAIIVVNLQTIFLKLLDIPREWQKSSYDCAVWLFACIACVVLNADGGLLASVLFSLFLVALRTMLSPVTEEGRIQTSHWSELRSVDNYSLAEQMQGVKMMKITAPLYFMNAEIFTTKVFSQTGVDPFKVRERVNKMNISNHNKDKNGQGGMESSKKKLCCLSDDMPVKVVVLDAAAVAFVDVIGIQALQFLVDEFSSVDVEVMITNVPVSIIPMLKSTGFWVRHADRLFLTVEAALATTVSTDRNYVHLEHCVA